MDSSVGSGPTESTRAPVRRWAVLVFTDIVGSTRLLAALGDLEGNRRILEHHRLAARVLRKMGGGKIINTGGDSIFLAFDKPRQALRFALKLQRELRNWLRNEPPHLRVHDRVGIHYGEVEETQRPDGANDLTGLAVSVAFSIMDLASADQILLSEAAFDAARAAPDEGELAEFGALRWLSHGRYSLKNVDEPFPVFEVGEEGTAHLQPPSREVEDRSPEDDLTGWRPAIGIPVPGTQWVIERFLGGSGFGEVWLARDAQNGEVRALRFCFRPGRIRALRESTLLFEKLRSEACAHRNIARLHTFDFDHPPHYLANEYVPGVTLTEFLRDTRGAMAIEESHRLEIIAQAAEALAAAHRSGIIHGDLKPAALVVQSAGDSQRPPRVKVIEFGTGLLVARELREELARAARQGAQLADVTLTAGAPLYWAPELFKGGAPSPASDIYALGVLLYQVTVGDLTQPVTVDVARRVRDPLLLDDILACLATDPKARLASAAELASRLRRLPERRRELQRRERRAYWQGALRTGAVAAVVIGLMAWLAWQAMKKEEEATQAARNASLQQGIAEAREVTLLVANGVRLMEDGDLAGALQQFVEALGKDGARPDREEIHRRRIASVLRSAPRQVQEWHLHGPVVALAIDPAGHWMGAGSGDGEIRIWNIEDQQEIGSAYKLRGPVSAMGFTSDRKAFYAHSQRGPLLFFPWNENEGLGAPRHLLERASSVACSPDGSWFSAGIGDSRVALVACGDPTFPTVELTGLADVAALAFSRNGQLLAGAANRGRGGKPMLALWEVRGGKLLHRGEAPGAPIRFLSFDPNDQWLLMATDREVHLLSVTNLTPAAPPRRHEDYVMWAGFAPRGTYFMSTSAGARSRVQVSDVASPAGLPVVLPHPHSVTGGDLSPDGRYVLTGCFDRRLRLWDPARVQLVAEPMRHPAWRNHSYFQVRFLPDGRRAVTAVDNAIRIFDFASHAHSASPVELEQPLQLFSLSANGTRIAASSRDGLAAVWNATTGERMTRRIRHPGGVHRVIMDAEGRRLIALEEAPAESDDLSRIWITDLEDPELRPVELGRLRDPQVSLAPSMGRLDVIALDGKWYTWDLKRPEAAPIQRDLGVRVEGAVLSPDASALATISREGEGRDEVYLWNFADGAALCPPLRPGFRIRRFAFNRDGTRLVTACTDGLLEPRPAIQWDVATGQRIDPLLWHEDGVLSVACHPTDGRVVTGGEDSLVRLWNSAATRALDREQRMGYQVLDVAFSQNGRLFAAASADGTARVWETESGEPLTPVLRHPGIVWRVWFTADARHLLTQCEDGRGYLWDLAPIEGSPAELVRLVDAIKGDSEPPPGGMRRASTDSGVWKPPLAVSPVAIAAWHRREAGLWFNEGRPELAVSHLDHALKAQAESWVLHWDRGVLRESIGMLEEAVADFREVLRLDPDCLAAKERIERLSR